MEGRVTLRPGVDADMPALLDLWVSAWTRAMPEINFVARREWLREWQESLVAEGAVIAIAQQAGTVVGYVIVNPDTAYLDQLAVDPGHWGQGIADLLLDEARRISPARLSLHVNQSNGRAISFYERTGFRRMGEGINPRSGLPIFSYEWTPAGEPVAGA
jgi:putative acetyltransferase